MTTTPRQRQRLAVHRFGREAMLRELALQEAAVVRTDKNPYGALDDATIRRLRRLLLRAAVALPGDLKGAFVEGIAEGVAWHRKPPRPGRRAGVGHLTDLGLALRMNQLMEGGLGARKAADVAIAEHAARIRRHPGAPLPTANAVWLKKHRKTTS
ncbi:MAG: hypothetical protein WCP68_11510 [Enhydrobacter sp.]